MYVTDAFAEHRIEAMHDLIDAHPLAALVRVGADGLEADHVPFELAAVDDHSHDTPYGVLRAHVARKNPLALQDGVPVLAVFQGHSSYVSSTLYDLHAAGGRGVPTWNYTVVHAHGVLRVIDDAGWTLAHMTRMSARRERANGSDWKVDDAPRDYIDRMVAATVGIEIAIVRMEAKFKLSQNRSAADRERVLQHTKT